MAEFYGTGAPAKKMGSEVKMFAVQKEGREYVLEKGKLPVGERVRKKDYLSKSLCTKSNEAHIYRSLDSFSCTRILLAQVNPNR